MLTLIPYESKYHADFKALNLEWLDLHGLTEPYDLEILNDPIGKIIEPGGVLFLLIDGDRAYGTGGLQKVEEGVYELVKMSLDPSLRGQGYGKLILEKCLEEARKMNLDKLILFSSTKLKTALALYEKYGFRHVAVTDSPMETADVKMELVF